MVRALLVWLVVCLAAGPAGAGEVRVAAAANVAAAAREIGQAFTAETGHRVVFSFASTGQLYAQIARGAPFDVFLAADRVRPERAEADGLAVAGSRFTYALGRLALYSRDPGRITGPDALTDEDVSRLAIANPDTAPYGAAALQVLAALGVAERVSARIVRGASIAQTYQFVATGNVEIGFVAASQVAGHERGSRWMVPESLHDPIAQDAVLLSGAADAETAREFLTFLKTSPARAVLARYGYVPGG